MQIRGVTPDVFFGHDDLPGLVDVFTPYPRGKELVINAGQITPEVVRALVPVFSLEDAKRLLGEEEGGEESAAGPEGVRDFLAGELNLHVPGLGEKVRLVEPEVVRVEARADIHQTRNQAAVVAIVQLGGSDTDLPLVLSWVDRAPMRSDGPGASPPPNGAGPS